MPRIKTRDYHISWLRQRELGQRRYLGESDRFSKEIYSSITPSTCWDHSEHLRNALHGGVFNLEFSPDGSLLVAACEKRSILMFDPLCRKLVHAVDNAHRDCVNCVRFLDSRVFATCSDDSTVALWDARNLKTQIRTLHGHSNWVKNIEFSARDSLLVTSGFDGSIYTWDINSYTENGFVYKRVFHTNGLMRTRLNPDASKMIICTTGGYLMIIHDLDLNTLAQDLAGFKPNMYRLMQLSQATIPLAADYTHLFSKTRQVNRVEIVSDFPKGDEAEVVSSLQIHPQGWCALSRNISNDENSEWTCVHDIQDQETNLEYNADINENMQEEFKADSDSEGESDEIVNRDCRTLGPFPSRRQFAAPPFLGRPDNRRNDSGIPVDVRRTVDERGRRGFSPASVELHVSSSDVWEALVAIREARVRRERERERERERAENTSQRSARTHRHQVVDNSVARAIEALRDEEDDGEEDEDAARRRIRTGTVRILVHRNGGNSSDSQRAEAVPQTRILRVRGRGGQESAGLSTGQTVSPGSSSESSLQNSLNASSAEDNSQSAASSSSSVYVVDRSDLQPQTSATSSTTTTEPRSISRMYRLANNVSVMRQENGSKRNRMIHQNIPRLTHYIKEPNLGKGFIKELCFSADGRLICSPYGVGIRLLSFSPDCAELSSCIPQKPPVPLYELSTSMCHTDIVVSTKFSPQHYLLVSGCLTGKIIWHQPVV